MIKPAGTYILVELDPVEEVSQGGIIVHGGDEQKKREQAAEERGTVIAIGPAAFSGWAGCGSPNAVERAADTIRRDKLPWDSFETMVEHFRWNDPEYPPHRQWGIDIGSKVEFKKYEGKDSKYDEFKRHRYIPDIHIVGVVDND